MRDSEPVAWSQYQECWHRRILLKQVWCYIGFQILKRKKIISTRLKGERLKPTKSLLSQRQLLQLIKSILLRRTVDDSILEKITVDATMINCALDSSTLFFASSFKFVRVTTFVVNKTRSVVSLVEKLKNRAEDLGLFVGKRDAFAGDVHVSIS